jgi:hypothetical protein
VENPTDSLGILTPIYSATLVDSAALSALFVATDSGTAKIKVQITQGAVTIAAIATVVVEYRVLDSLLVVADVTGNQVANTDSITFTINAYDVNQVPMNISPIWNVEPAGLGALIPLDQSKARFKPYPGTIGQIFITVFDSLSGISSSFNTLNLNPEEQGLFITQQITNSSDITVYDSAGFQLEIPPGCVDPGSSMEIILRRLPLPQVKKTSPSFEIHMNSYQLSADAQFSQNLLSGNISMMLTLPIPEETQRLQTSIGRWNETELEWEDLNGNVSPDGAYISAPINGFSEFVVLGESKHLGIENLEFHPDPFSPNTQKKLQIEFILNSLISETPIVSIKIYNMRGDLVRKVLEYESMPKGAHLYDNGVFQQGAVDGSVEWDGLTDAGLTARNGRYLVQVLVEDPSGKKEKFDTVVLIK